MKKLLLILLLVSPAFGQTFAGTAGSDIFIPSPFRFCMGVDNYGDTCAVQSKNQEMQWSGSVDFKWAFRTVGTLPAASALNLGRTYEVTDGQSNTDCTSGGGSALAICTSNGSTWNALGSSGSGSGSGGVPNTLPNCTATGTTLNSGVSFSTQVVNSVTTLCAQTSAVSSNVVVGVATSGAGTSGSVSIAYSGYANCVFDNQTTQGDYVVASASNAGQCSDIGAGKPSGTVEVIGIVASTNSGGGTLANVLVNPLSLYTPGGTNNSGNVNNAAQFRLPFYSSPGTLNVLSGDSNCSLSSGFLTGCLGITVGNGGTTGAITLFNGSLSSNPASGNGTIYTDPKGYLACDTSGGASCASNGVYGATASGLQCDGSTNDTAALSTLLTAIGAKQSVIQFPVNSKCIIGTITIPTNVALDFSPGAALQAVTSQTTTIEGGINNPDNHRIFFNAFSGQGTVDPSTNNTALSVVYPEWWGAVAGGNSTTNQSAIQAAIIGAFGSNRTNASGLGVWNKELKFSGQYSVNGTLNVYHMIGFVWSCVNRNDCGLIETASNTSLINGQSVAYGVFRDIGFSTNAAQNTASPLVNLDYNASQGTDLAIQFVDFDHDNFGGPNTANIGVEIARSGGTAQGSNITFYNDAFSGFSQACLMIGLGNNHTPTNFATNAITIKVQNGDFQGCSGDGFANYGGGLIDINNTTFEDGLDSSISGALAQTGYDMFCYIAVNGEFCTAENVRSQSLWLIGGFGWVVNNIYNLDSINVLVPGATPAVGAIIQGSGAADGVYYQVTGSTSGASGLGTVASPRTASSGSATTIVDSVGGLSVNAWVGWQVSYVANPGPLQYCVITSNTANTFTCSAGWQEHFLNQTIANPVNGTHFIVEPNWGTQTTSGGITWGALTKQDLGCSACGGNVSAVMKNVFIPGVLIGGPQLLSGTQGDDNITSTRSDAFTIGNSGYFAYTGNNERVVITAGLSGAGAGAGSGTIDQGHIRKPVFYQTSSVGIPGAGAAIGATNGMAYLLGEQRQNCWFGGPSNGSSNLGADICEGVSVTASANSGAWYVDNASASTTPKRMQFTPGGTFQIQGGTFLPNSNVYTLAQNCAGVPNCTQIFGDGQSVSDATSTSTTTVTCPNNDCNFTQADVGKTFWATSKNNSEEVENSVCPVTTISTVNSAQSVTLALSCTASGSGNVVIYWGHRDGATLAGITNAVGCVSIVPFTGAVILIDQAIFKTPPSCATSGISQATNVPQQDWVPVGSTVTLIITPDFNYSTCTGNGGSFLGNTVCIGSGLSQMYNTLIWGTGLTPGQNANCANASGKTIFALNPLGGFIDNFDMAGVCPGETGNGVVLNSFDEQWREGGAQNVMTKACVSASTALNTYNLDCLNDGGGLTNVGHWLTNNSTQSDFGTFPYDNVLIDSGSTLKSHGATFRSPAASNYAVVNNGTHISDGDTYTCNIANEGCVNLSGSMQSRGSTFGGITGGSSNAIVMSSANSNFYDGGGNTTVGGFAGCATITSPSCNISGAQVLSAGCRGTVTASSTLGLYPYGQLTTPNCTSTTVNLGAPMTRIGTAQGLNVINSAAGVNASSGVVTVLINGVATGITCTIGTSANGCRDFTHTASYALGDVISFQVTSQAADTLAGIKATVLVW